MIVIRIDMWPGGLESKAYPLATGKIINTLTTETLSRGNYKIELTLKNRKRVWRTGEIQGFKRKAYNVWYLLNFALLEILGND